MNGNHWINGSVALMLGSVLALPAQAQEMDRPGGPRPVPPVMEELDRMAGPEQGTGGKPGGGDESGRHFEAKKRERLMQALQLDEPTRARLSQRLEQLDQKSEELRRQRQEGLHALREQALGLRKETRRGPRGGDARGTEARPPGDGPAI